MSTTETDDWADLCALSDVPEIGGAYVVHNDHGVAVFRSGDDQVRVLDDACPHAGGSLSGGHIHDGCVVCPWHGWPFDAQTGQCPDNPAVMVNTYPSRIVAGRVEAKMQNKTQS